MNTLDITVLLNKKPTTFTVIPADNTENSYSTYFQLFLNNEPYCEIRLNDDMIWEVCKGHELPEEELALIIEEVESSWLKPVAHTTEAATREVEKPSVSWFSRILNVFSAGKSAA